MATTRSSKRATRSDAGRSAAVARGEGGERADAAAIARQFVAILRRGGARGAG